MRIISIFCILLQLTYISKAQNIVPGLYINSESDEFICIDSDIIMFRLRNYDAFGSFSIVKGNFHCNTRGKCKIISCNSILENTSIINKSPRNDSLIVIKTLHSDSSPIISAYLYLNIDKHYNNSHVYVSDKYGKIVLNDSIANVLANKHISILVKSIGFSTKKILLLEPGNNYVIQSIMPSKYPFTIFGDNKISINIIKDKEIEIDLWNNTKLRNMRMKTILRQVDANFKCTQFIFDKEVTDFIE
jgi:hypothetical protein